MKSRGMISGIFLGLMLTLLLFQNCAADPKSKAQLTASSLEDEDSTFLKALESDDIRLATNQKFINDFGDDGECVWSFVGSDQNETGLSNTGLTMVIKKIRKDQAGTYKLFCEDDGGSRGFTFKVAVSPRTVIPPSTSTGTLRGYFILNGVKSLFIETPNVTEASALAICIRNASANPNKGVECTWDLRLIYLDAEPTDTLLVYEIDSDGVLTLVRNPPNLTYDQARAECTKLVSQFSSSALKCTWGPHVLHQAPIPPRRAANMRYTVVGEVETLHSNMPNRTREEASAECVSLGAALPLTSIRCRWDGQVIYNRMVAPNYQIKVYRMIGMSEDLVYTSNASLFRADARTECNARIADRPITETTRCKWNNEILVERAAYVPPPRGTVNAFIVQRGRENFYKRVNDITEAAARQTCQSEHAKAPQYHVRCRWEGKLIFDSHP